MSRGILTVTVFVVLAALFAFAANDWRLPGAAAPAGPAQVAPARGGTAAVREREPREGECPNTLVRITLGPDVARQAAFEFQTAETRTISDTIRANAETRYVPSRCARVAPRIHGVVRDVKAALGQEVQAGATLATLECPDFAEAKAAQVQASAVLDLRRQVYEQEKDFFERKISSGREFLQARTAMEEAKLALQRASQKLAALGLSADQIKAVVDKQDTSAMMDVAAPFAGTVVEAAAVPGEAAVPDRPIFGVAAMDRLWIAIDVYEPDLPKIEKGQRVGFTVEGLQGRRFHGAVVAIGSEVDDRTRTVPVFAEVKNTQSLLRARMFGRAEIAVRPPEAKLLVPKAAVQNDGDCNLVFVSPAKDIFQARKIEIGAIYEGGYVEVVGGLAAGEKVVTTGSFLLKSEALRGQMGAG